MSSSRWENKKVTVTTLLISLKWQVMTNNNDQNQPSLSPPWKPSHYIFIQSQRPNWTIKTLKYNQTYNYISLLNKLVLSVKKKQVSALPTPSLSHSPLPNANSQLILNISTQKIIIIIIIKKVLTFCSWNYVDLRNNTL